MTTLRLPPDALCFLRLLAGQSAWAVSPLAGGQAALQQTPSGGPVDDALRACDARLCESACQNARRDVLAAPGACPGFGRGTSLARLAAACEKADGGLHGVGHQPLCKRRPPPPLSAELFAGWGNNFQTEVRRPECVPATEALLHALRAGCPAEVVTVVDV